MRRITFRNITVLSSVALALTLSACGDDDALDPTAGTGGNGGEAGDKTDGGETGAASCSLARAELLGGVELVSGGAVEDISEQDASDITLRVDASAGGFMNAANNPYIYLSLVESARVNVTDLEAFESSDWDIALKRDNLRANSGDSGPGQVEVASLTSVAYDEVTLDAADEAEFGTDDFLDQKCNSITDETGKPVTRFDGWYEYDSATMSVSPAERVFLVRTPSATYKLQILDYYQQVQTSGGTPVTKSAVYTLKFRAL